MSYYLVTYDISENRVNKVRKILIKYLNWVQNSVFEGESNKVEIIKCKQELKKIINNSQDSVYFYEMPNPKLFYKEVLGKDRMELDNMI